MSIVFEESSRLLTPKETAERLGLCVNTLAFWRCTHRYPLPYTRSGRRIKYRLADVEEFLRSRTEAA
jgi:excisionase family DNA binding protein